MDVEKCVYYSFPILKLIKYFGLARFYAFSADKEYNIMQRLKICSHLTSLNAPFNSPFFCFLL